MQTFILNMHAYSKWRNLRDQWKKNSIYMTHNSYVAGESVDETTSIPGEPQINSRENAIWQSINQSINQ